jgi:membrane protease YdiL (CAAX protease family)
MKNIATILAALFTLYIGFVRPLLRRRRYQQFRREVATNPALRSQYYLESLVEPWFWLIAIGIILILDSAPPSVLGLHAPTDWGTTFWLTLEIVILTPIVSIVMRYRITKTQRPGLSILLFEVKELLPRTPYEFCLWFLISITAGICEEIVFRGFLIAYLGSLFPYLGFQVPLLFTIILTSILFGFAHIYQGWKGALGAAVAGVILACLYLSTGSLILPIIAHILIDVRIVFIAPALLKLKS